MSISDKCQRAFWILSQHVFAFIIVSLVASRVEGHTIRCRANAAFHTANHHGENDVLSLDRSEVYQRPSMKLVPWSGARQSSQFQEHVTVDETRGFAISAVITKSRGEMESNIRVTRGRRRLLESNGAMSHEEVGALISFKSAISSDPLGSLKSWHPNDSTACSWAGVVCSSLDIQYPHHVIAISLSQRQLVGNITSALLALNRLDFLQRVDLSLNAFTGSIHGVAFINRSSLSYLNLSFNQVGGVIPSQIGELVNLVTLDFASNKMLGQIPLSISNCTSLKTLNLGTNLFDGPIPEVLGRLSHLETLNLGTYVPSIVFSNLPSYGNTFSGSIPPALCNCSALRYLNLSYNPHLGGQFPVELSELQNLQSLILSWCSFTGALSPWLGNLTSLRVGVLSSNEFHDEVPDTVGRLQNLTIFYIGNNYLSGAFPQDLFNCTALSRLALEENMLSGVLPSRLGLLKNLEVLTLFGNNFTGVIPPSLQNCSSLQHLEMSVNPSMDRQLLPSWMGSLSSLVTLFFPTMNFGGRIPHELSNLSKLKYLDLQSNHFTGAIPSSLANCTSLDHLWLYSNSLSGEVPPEIGFLPNLEYLDISNNFFSGLLPVSFTNATQLRYFYIGSNSFSGKIDGDWGKLSQLQRVQFNNNQFGGPIPETFSNCSTLLYISLAHNNFFSDIPASFGNLSLLEQLLLSNNQIYGVVPVELSRCSKLGLLDLRSNNLQGSLLSDMGGLFSLTRLYLSENRFSGAVPDSLSNYSSLEVLDLSHNLLSGSIPGHSFSRMSKLISLNLSHNLFSGPWPRQLSSLDVIQEVDVSANNLSGSILGLNAENWNALSRLDISINHFSGVIPVILASLPILTFFNASYNTFSGPIPNGGVFRSNLTEESFLGNPNLCGVILGPSRQCLAVANLPPSTPCNGFTCKRIWIPTVCIGVGVALVFTIVICLVYRKRHYPGVVKEERDYVLILNSDSYPTLSPSDILRIISGDGTRDNVIGSSAKSVVYKGSLPGTGVFAVKILLGNKEETSPGGDVRRVRKQLVNEAQTLAKLRHRNILKVLRFYSTPDFKGIVMEYMSKGSLHDHLYPLGGGICEIPWVLRFDISIDVAEGMKYLHHDFPRSLIHGDLKPSNILLDDDLVAKVADFGLSKFVDQNKHEEAIASTSNIYGTIGYVPPEYALGTNISTKGDVYSYGIVLLELLTGRRPAGDDFGPEADYRTSVLKYFWEIGSEILDPTLKHEGAMDQIKNDQMTFLIRVALLCTRDIPRSRPSMDNVVSMLMQIKDKRRDPTSTMTMEELATGNANSNLAASYGIGMRIIEERNDEELPSTSHVTSSSHYVSGGSGS